MSDYYYDPSEGKFDKIRDYDRKGLLSDGIRTLADRAARGLKKYATKRSELPDAWDVDFLWACLSRRKNKDTRNYRATANICHAYDNMRTDLRLAYTDSLTLICGFLKQLEENKKLKAILEEEGIEYEDRLA